MSLVNAIPCAAHDPEDDAPPGFARCPVGTRADRRPAFVVYGLHRDWDCARLVP